MNLSKFKEILTNVENLQFKLPNGSYVPAHFHVTEIGIVQKNYIDCGGTVRTENTINFQLWVDTDTQHRLKPHKLLDIISVAEKSLSIFDYEIEVSYQENTIGIFDLEFNGLEFVLNNKFTNCLAQDNCGIVSTNPEIINPKTTNTSCCSPNSGCC